MVYISHEIYQTMIDNVKIDPCKQKLKYLLEFTNLNVIREEDNFRHSNEKKRNRVHTVKLYFGISVQQPAAGINLATWKSFFSFFLFENCKQERKRNVLERATISFQVQYNSFMFCSYRFSFAMCAICCVFFFQIFRRIFVL